MKKITDYVLKPQEEEVVRIFEFFTKKSGETIRPNNLIGKMDHKRFDNSDIVEGLKGLEEKGLLEDGPNGSFKRLWVGEFESAA